MNPPNHAMTGEMPVPGTVHLVDLDHTMATKHSTRHKDIVLVPTPSADPEDPLNWSSSRKTLHMVCLCVYVLIIGIAGSVVYSVLVPLAAATDLSVADLNAGTGYLFFLCGWALLFWQPFALQFGKRPTYLLSVLGNLAFTLWSPYTTSNGQWIAKNILQGFFSAAVEALPEVSITDVYFAHQRGTCISFYALFVAGSNYFAPFICGFINDGMGYKWVFYWPAIFLGVGFVFLFFFMEETNYDRKTVGIVEANVVSATGSQGASELEVNPKSADSHQILDSEKTSMTFDTSKNQEAIREPVSPSRKTFRQKLALWDTGRPNLFFSRAKQQLLFLGWPVVFWAGFQWGCHVIWFNVMNATASIILGGTPYNFSTSMVGLSYLSCMIGLSCGVVFAGRFSDWLVIRLARRNGGIMEPEQRLWIFFASLIIIPCSLILWGVGAAHGIHWFGLIVAMATLAFCIACGCTISISYVMDSYKDMGGNTMTTLTIIRNSMSFAMGYGITPWLDGLGYQNCFISAAFVSLVITSGFLVMIKFGKRLRARSRIEYWALVNNDLAAGMSH